MKYNKLPRTDLNVSRVALGTWQFSGDWWGPIAVDTCINTVRAALDAGINFIDTAPIYGFGRAEEILGRALAGKRDKAVLATKCGLEKAGKSIKINLKPDAMRLELEQSLKRLKTDVIDLYQIHWPDPETPLEETMGAMEAFIAEGKVKAVGVCNFDLDQIKKAKGLSDIKAVQNEFSLLKRDVEKEILPFCEESGTGFLAYGPLGGGILSGKYREMPKFPAKDARSLFYQYYRADAFKIADDTVSRLREIAQSSQCACAQCAIAWILAKPGVLSAIAGAKSPEQARANAASADLELDLSHL